MAKNRNKKTKKDRAVSMDTSEATVSDVPQAMDTSESAAPVSASGVLIRTCTMSSGRGFFGGGRGQTPPAQARGSQHRLHRRNLVDSSPDARCSSPTSNSFVNPHLQSSPNPPPVIHPTSLAPSPTPHTSTGDAPDLPTPPPELGKKYRRSTHSLSHWNSSEYLQKRELGKKYRSSQTSGCLHSGGCIPHSEHQKRLRQELGHDPTYHDIFRRTHVIKGTQDQFIDPRSATINDSFVKLKDTSSQGSTSDIDGCEQQPIDENEIFLQATGGMSKKGRVYGIGSEARRLRSSSSSSSSSIGYFGSHSQNYYLQQEIEERIARMNAELRDTIDTQQQHIVEQDRKLEAMERMLASQQQMMQQYFASMGIQPQPPTDYPEDNWEARNETEDEDDDID